MNGKMNNLSKWNIFLVILSIIVILTTALPLDDSNEPTLKAATSGQSTDHLHLSPPWPIRTHNLATSDPRLTPTPPTSLSHPAPNSLSPRSLASIPGWTHHFVKTQLIVPVKDSARLVSQDINATMHRMIRHVRAVDARAPSSQLVIGYGELQMVFWSPRVLAWNFVARIIEYYLLLGTMIFTHFTLLWVKYASLAAVALAFYHHGNRPV
ncbi:MAG: hypothetical protein Q9173_003692 [Seirophora scorigena]